VADLDHAHLESSQDKARENPRFERGASVAAIVNERNRTGEADFVVARWTATGTFTGEWGGTAPTRKSATFSGVNIFRFGNDGKVTELLNHRDDLGLMEQLGAAVYAGAAPAAVTASPEPSGLKGHS